MQNQNQSDLRGLLVDKQLLELEAHLGPTLRFGEKLELAIEKGTVATQFRGGGLPSGIGCRVETKWRAAVNFGIWSDAAAYSFSLSLKGVKSQSFTVLSKLAEARRFPSGLNATRLT